MNSAWQQFTLSNLRLHQWRGASYLYRLVGLLQAWRQGSWLMQWGEAIGAVLVALVFTLTPFVPNSLVAVLLFAGGAFWALLTLSDETVYPQGLPLKVTPIHLLVLLYFGVSVVATALSPVKQAAATGLGKLTLYLLFFALMARILRSLVFATGLLLYSSMYRCLSVLMACSSGFRVLRHWQLGLIQLRLYLKRRVFIAFWVTRIYWRLICYLRSLYRLWLSLFGVAGVPKP